MSSGGKQFGSRSSVSVKIEEIMFNCFVGGPTSTSGRIVAAFAKQIVIHCAVSQDSFFPSLSRFLFLDLSFFVIYSPFVPYFYPVLSLFVFLPSRPSIHPSIHLSILLVPVSCPFSLPCQSLLLLLFLFLVYFLFVVFLSCLISPLLCSPLLPTLLLSSSLRFLSFI